MSERSDQLSAHHSNLRARIAVQRRHLGETAQDIEVRLSRIDRGIGAVRTVARNPLLIAGGVALVAWAGPKRLLSWATRSALFYSTAKRVLRMVR